MEPEVKAYFEAIKGTIEKFEQNVTREFDLIREANYVKKTDCDEKRKPCEKEFSDLEEQDTKTTQAVDELKKIVWKALGAVAVLTFLAQFIFKSLKISL